MMEQYELLASNVSYYQYSYPFLYSTLSQLLEWIAQVMPWLLDRTPETTLQDAQVYIYMYIHMYIHMNIQIIYQLIFNVESFGRVSSVLCCHKTSEE